MSEINEWANWIEEAISRKHIRYYEYEYFSNIQEIGVGGFGKVYRANYKSSEQYFVLKSLLNLESSSIRELVNEVIFFGLHKVNFFFDTYFRIYLFN
jgi:hypothetical protein